MKTDRVSGPLHLATRSKVPRGCVAVCRNTTSTCGRRRAFLLLTSWSCFSELKVACVSLRLALTLSHLSQRRYWILRSPSCWAWSSDWCRFASCALNPHLVRMKICLGHDVRRFSRCQYGICKELLDQIGVVCLQEFHQKCMDVLVNMVHQIIHFELFLAQLSQILVNRIVEVYKPGSNHSQVTMPLKICCAITTTVWGMRCLPCGLSFALPRCWRGLLLKLRRLLPYLLLCLGTPWVRAVKSTLLISVDLFLEWAHYQAPTTRNLPRTFSLSSLRLSLSLSLVT